MRGNTKSLGSSELGGSHWGAAHFPSQSPLYRWDQEGAGHISYLCPLATQRGWNANGTSASPPGGGGVRCNAAPQIFPAQCSLTRSSDYDWQRCKASAHTQPCTNPPTLPQTCSPSTPEAEATAPQLCSAPHSNRNEHLDIVHKCKASWFQSFRGERMRGEEEWGREGTELSDIYKFVVGEIVGWGGGWSDEKYCLFGNKVASEVLPEAQSAISSAV